MGSTSSEVRTPAPMSLPPVNAIELSYSVSSSRRYDLEKEHRAVGQVVCAVVKKVDVPSWVQEVHLELEADFFEQQEGDARPELKIEDSRARALLSEFEDDSCFNPNGFEWSSPKNRFTSPPFTELPLSKFVHKTAGTPRARLHPRNPS